ncbi:MAG: saccharopine dehydrogenase NADP-binding domain-containing protein [Erysipelotrichaceae bacterium]|nr:saccharopine dehydrogenase NADP-binding domain-containing protein [Erysipelotrichaceae bacterium]
MKKVMVCGCGAQGSTICRKLDEEPNIEEVVCCDYDLDTAKAVCRLMKKGTPKRVDASCLEEIIEAGKGCELLVNAMPLDYGVNMLKAAMKMGCCYQDLSACENIPECADVDKYDRWLAGIRYMYEGYGKIFKDNGATAIIGTGSAPGIMCILARKCVNELDECDTINMMVYEGVEARRFLPFWWSTDVALADMQEDAYALEEGRIIRTRPFSRKIWRRWPEYDMQPVMLCEHAHDEPVYVAFNSETYFKGCKNAYFKYGGVGIRFSEPLYRAGLLSWKEEEINGQKIVPHELVLRHLPLAPKDPKEIKEIIDEGIISDGGAFVIEAYGKKDGKDVMAELHLSAPGLIESYEKAKMTGEMYLTGQGAFLYTRLFVNDLIDQKGLISSDMLDDGQVEQYLKWTEELGITYTLEIREDVLPDDLKEGQ